VRVAVRFVVNFEEGGESNISRVRSVPVGRVGVPTRLQIARHWHATSPFSPKAP
jgi:hypothetical protein